MSGLIGIATMGALTQQEEVQSASLAEQRLLAGLTSEEWQRWGTHAERGHMTVADLARHMPEHDAAHIEQIRRILHPPSSGDPH